MRGDGGNEVSSTAHFFAGTAAGMAEWFVGHPLDTIRVRIIAGSSGNVWKPPGSALKQLISGLSSVSGIVSLYRGSLSEIFSAVLGGSLLFGVNNVFRRVSTLLGNYDAIKFLKKLFYYY